MKKEDTLFIQSRNTNFEEVEYIRKDALLEWIKHRMSIEQGFSDAIAEHGYKTALIDLMTEIKGNYGKD